MIPKVIHYCWFGGKPLPDLAKKCIASWENYFPGYEIKEWNESNFDLNCCDYVKEAYEARKWAFVSDYARFKILYEHGGIYFDTDVEVIKPFDDILSRGGFMGQEIDVLLRENPTGKEADTLKSVVIAPGLGIAAASGLQLYKELLNYYDKLHFIKCGVIDTTTICIHTTNVLKKYGYDEHKMSIQYVAGITIYPPEYFCPLNYKTGEIIMTDSTRSIHWYGATWRPNFEIKMSDKRRICIEKYGNKKGLLIFNVITIPDRLERAISERGVLGTVIFLGEKMKMLLLN